VKKTDLLTLLVRRHPDIDEKKLYALVLCGEIRVNSETVRDPRFICRPDAVVEIVPRKRYVSRGGDKLAGALNALDIDCRGKTFIDCGASTGGFTHCLLSRGAKKIYAVDVGYAQFDYALSRDPRIDLRERTNVMSLLPESFDEPPEAAVIDLSFRKLSGAARHILRLVREAWALALVKPQFEWSRPAADFTGVVRSDEDRKSILLDCAQRLSREGVMIEKAVPSSITGARGNREYFFLISNHKTEEDVDYCPLIASLFSGG
jgi:23S rRNA (cytidine1920-2'-O)/16S rRNA (cytidine1409-2'-O)-methyltransferase